MRRAVLILVLSILHIKSYGQGSALKSVIYDFDGLDIGQTDLPDGDYRNGDLTYQVAATPLVSSDVLGDRALQLNLNWSGGSGEFGKAVSRFIDLDAGTDRLSFYLYNPLSNDADSILELIITEDDNSNNIYEVLSDDKWVDTLIIHRSAGWQLISVPLSSFSDGNPGSGNGIFDAGYAGSGSMLFSVGFIFHRTSFSGYSQFFLDMICLTEGTLPVGATPLDLPAKEPSDHCQLGALCTNDYPDFTPDTISGIFADPNLTFVNWFLNYSKTGTVANQLPGPEVSNLLAEGYVPVITWEMMYESYARLDPVQPRLSQILNGSFDAYIDAFADQVKSYNAEVILRIFHEFEGNWYSWSLAENGADVNTFISAWKHVVDRFRARGANNVKWMWCVNAEPKPYVDYNWIIDAYPGDDYVDIVATDIYNHPDTGVPQWKSFRYTIAESYYYLTKHFPGKPFYICEVGSRERYPGEPFTSQSKAEWTCRMSKELQSYFRKTRALIFFSIQKEHDWRLNSSAAAKSAATSCIWEDSYFVSSPMSTSGQRSLPGIRVYPNPFREEIILDLRDVTTKQGEYRLRIHDLLGKKVFETSGDHLPEQIRTGADLMPGVYIAELICGDHKSEMKIVKAR